MSHFKTEYQRYIDRDGRPQLGHVVVDAITGRPVRGIQSEIIPGACESQNDVLVMSRQSRAAEVASAMNAGSLPPYRGEWNHCYHGGWYKGAKGACPCNVCGCM